MIIRAVHVLRNHRIGVSPNYYRLNGGGKVSNEIIVGHNAMEREVYPQRMTIS